MSNINISSVTHRLLKEHIYIYIYIYVCRVGQFCNWLQNIILYILSPYIGRPTPRIGTRPDQGFRPGALSPSTTATPTQRLHLAGPSGRAPAGTPARAREVRASPASFPRPTHLLPWCKGSLRWRGCHRNGAGAPTLLLRRTHQPPGELRRELTSAWSSSPRVGASNLSPDLDVHC
jgi:hypothetical protein